MRLLRGDLLEEAQLHTVITDLAHRAKYSFPPESRFIPVNVFLSMIRMVRLHRPLEFRIVPVSPPNPSKDWTGFYFRTFFHPFRMNKKENIQKMEWLPKSREV